MLSCLPRKNCHFPRGCRIRYGDDTAGGEERSWENFLAICRKPAPGILEFCGLGPHADEVRDDLLCSMVPVPVIWLTPLLHPHTSRDPVRPAQPGREKKRTSTTPGNSPAKQPFGNSEQFRLMRAGNTNREPKRQPDPAVTYHVQKSRHIS
jgi:hypothetical protein